MKSFIVVASPAYGGAEKRFFDVFTAMRRRGVDVGFIAPSCLLDLLLADYPDREDVLRSAIAVPMPHWRPLKFVWRLWRTVHALPRGSSFHYPLMCLWPLHVGRGDKVSLSVVDSARVPRLRNSTRNMKWTWLAMQFVNRIDVLNPANLDAMRAYRVSPRMSLTPGGTYLVPPADRDVPKRPAVVFLGRLVPLKGLDDFLDVLPALWDRMRACAPAGLSFDFAGYGPLEAHLVGRLEELRRQGVPARFLGYADASALLAESAVLVSMQERTNFPSRVVAEALVSGCGVIVRDTGDSRSFGEGIDGLKYCDATLSPEQLADLLLGLLREVLDSAARREAIKVAARQRYSSPAYLDYFVDLFGHRTPHQLSK